MRITCTWFARPRLQLGCPLLQPAMSTRVRRRRTLQDVLTADRIGKPVAEAGSALYPNGERHLRSISRLAAERWHRSFSSEAHRWHARARLLGIVGEVQRSGDVVHVVAQRLMDHTHLLGELPTESRDFH